MAHSAVDGFLQLTNIKKTRNQNTPLVKSLNLAFRQRKFKTLRQHFGSEKTTVLATRVAYKNANNGFDQQRYQAEPGTGVSFFGMVGAAVIHLIRSGVMVCSFLVLVTIFDKTVRVLFPAGPEKGTIPRLMFSGLREHINPAILLVVTLPVVVSILFLATPEALRRRSGRTRYGGEAPQN